MKTFYSLAVSTLLIVSLILPLVIYLFGDLNSVSNIEKRRLAEFPELRPEYESLRQFPEKYTVYFQDHFGLREKFVHLYDSTMLNIFGVSPSTYVIKGRDDWYFYVAGGIARDYFGLGAADDHTLEKYSQVLIDHRDWLESIGIHYLFVPVPNKINVYPEMLPARLQEIAGYTYYQQLLTYLGKETVDKSVVDVLSILRTSKSTHQVYYRSDTHWNYDGALDVYNEIISKLNRWFPDLRQLDESNILRKNERFSGDLTNMVHQMGVISESDSVISLKSNCAKSKDEMLPRSLTQYISESEDDLRTFPVQNGCSTRQYTVLLIHDSFGHYLRPYFNDQFKIVTYSGKYNLRELQDFIAELRPDIVIEERVSRDINQTLAEDIELEQKVVKFQMREPLPVVLSIPAEQKSDFIATQYNLEMTEQQSGLRIKATSSDPQLIMPFNVKNLGRQYNVMVELTAPADTQLLLFYLVPGVTEFSVDNSVFRKIKKGVNKLYFHLPGKGIHGKIRLDPGSAIGEYLLHSFVIKERPFEAPN